jgi:hypothetical protein
MKIKVWFRGVVDGWKQWQFLSYGMSYHSRKLNTAYDAGVNVGQALRRFRVKFLP